MSDHEIIFKNKKVDDQVMLTIFKYSIEAQKTLCRQDRILFFKTHNARIKMNNYYYTDKSTTLGYSHCLTSKEFMGYQHLQSEWDSKIKPDYVVCIGTSGVNLLSKQGVPPKN